MEFSNILDAQLERKNKIKIMLIFCLVKRTSSVALTEKGQKFISGQNKLAMSTNRQLDK